MKIVNNTDLSYRNIGDVIDQLIEYGKGDTHYYGQIEYCKCEVYHKGEPYIIKVQIRYLKNYVEWKFDKEENEL